MVFHNRHIIIVASISCVHCRYEQNIGLVRAAHFPKTQPKTAILSSEAGVIAALNLRTNKIGTQILPRCLRLNVLTRHHFLPFFADSTAAWRTLLANNEVAEAFVPSEDGHGTSHPCFLQDPSLISPAVIFTVSGNGKHASLWNVLDGSLLWSEDLYSFADMTDEQLAALKDKDLVSAKFIQVRVPTHPSVHVSRWLTVAVAVHHNRISTTTEQTISSSPSMTGACFFPPTTLLPRTKRWCVV
jgi:hypothetical protein